MPSLKELSSFPVDLDALPAVRADVNERTFARRAAPYIKRLAARQRDPALTAFERGDHSLPEMREGMAKKVDEKPAAFIDRFGGRYRLIKDLADVGVFLRRQMGAGASPSTAGPSPHHSLPTSTPTAASLLPDYRAPSV